MVTTRPPRRRVAPRARARGPRTRTGEAVRAGETREREPARRPGRARAMGDRRAGAAVDGEPHERSVGLTGDDEDQVLLLDQPFDHLAARAARARRRAGPRAPRPLAGRRRPPPPDGRRAASSQPAGERPQAARERSAGPRGVTPPRAAGAPRRRARARRAPHADRRGRRTPGGPQRIRQHPGDRRRFRRGSEHRRTEWQPRRGADRRPPRRVRPGLPAQPGAERLCGRLAGLDEEVDRPSAEAGGVMAPASGRRRHSPASAAAARRAGLAGARRP